jgi:hypothetical protein
MRRAVRSTAIGVFTVVALLSAGVRVTHAYTLITSCDQTVSGSASLANDLDCPPDSLAAVIHLGGSLDLAGHTIRGAQYSVICAEPLSDGTYDHRKCRVSNGTIADFAVNGVSGHKLDLRDLAFSGGANTFAVHVRKSLRFTNLHIENAPSSSGILGFNLQTVKGTNLTIEGGQGGVVEVGKATIDGIVVNGILGDGVSGAIVKLVNGSFTGGTNGIAAQWARVAATTVTGAETGINANRMQIKDSTVMGNGVDLASNYEPKVKNTTCNTSNGWGVCTND